ncbi:hypothetical protein [Planctomycetes bacterium K23_9]|uniref:Uncharacterized protein n=1 Tax=Stieleria marina TaxID=1930275 RepID=A0A517NW90_9BACT|nr:hypothetical protein K239x_33850 [Planctomycetes bacterium K23_9]
MNTNHTTNRKRAGLFRLIATAGQRRTLLACFAVAIAGTSVLVADQPLLTGPLGTNAASINPFTAEQVDPNLPTTVAPNMATPKTPFEPAAFDKSIRTSLMQIGDTSRSAPQTHTPSVPETQYDRQRFDQSINVSLQRLNDLSQSAATQSAATLSAPENASADTPSNPAAATPGVQLGPDVSLGGTMASTSLPSQDSAAPIAGLIQRPTGSVNASAMREMPIDAMQSTRSYLSGAQPSASGVPNLLNDDILGRGLENDGPISSAFANTHAPSVLAGGSLATQSTSGKPNSANCQPGQYHREDFSPTPIDAASTYHDGQREAWVYDAKRDVPTQRPLIEWPREWYGSGITPKGLNFFGAKNLVRPKLYLYGDYRTGIISGRNAKGRTDNWAHRLNLDLDYQLTDTERFHTFVGPLDNNNQFTRFQLVDGDVQFREEINFTPVTGFFEGDLGVMMGATHGRTSPFELPITMGLIPLLFQNGIWMEDALTGAAFALPARHSQLLNISNMDWTFFAGVDQLNSPAFDSDSAAQVFGTALFIEAYGGYIETGYAYLNDRNNDARDYHNATVSFTKRYFDRISNSVRVIVNAGQDGAKDNRTADGALLLVENSWITSTPLTVVPYANFFVGWDRPQSVARAAASGGILRNSGINFDTDGVNGFASLDATGSDSAGGAIGVDLIGDDLDKQLVIEAAYQTPHGSGNPNLPDDQFAIGSRFQVNLSHATLLRFDVMHGWRRGLVDVYGTRMEYRWKF